MVSTSVEKLFEIDTHVGCAVSGLTADSKMLVEHARVEAQVFLRLCSVSTHIFIIILLCITKN